MQRSANVRLRTFGNGAGSLLAAAALACAMASAALASPATTDRAAAAPAGTTARPAKAGAPAPAGAPAQRSDGAPDTPAVALGVVAGSATYRERIALSPQAVFEAVLEDVSRADAPSVVLGRTRIDAPGQVPVRFAIAYDPARLDRRGMYIVRATIREGERLAFTTDRLHRVTPDGRPQTLQLVLRAVAARPGGNGPLAAPPPPPFPAPPSPALPSPGVAPPPPQAPAPSAAAPRPGRTLESGGSALLGSLPAQWSGVLPCADCQGIRQTLDLHPDGAFHWRSEYLGKPPLDIPDDGGRWLFGSDGRTLLLFGGREAPVRFVLRDDGALRLLDLEGRPIRSTLNYELRRVPGEFKAFEPRLRLRGAYTYFADAAMLLDCATGQRLPVAMEGASLDLERAYTGARPAPAGAPRIVLLEGRIAQRAPMEGPGTRPTLVVDRFLRLGAAGEACPPPPANLPLEGTRWRLTQLQGGPVEKPGGRTREAFLQFDATAMRVTGSGGCNALAGGYALDGERLRFSQVAGTMMACGAAAMSQEQAFNGALGETTRWLVAGRLLELVDDADHLLARFEAATEAPRR